MKKAITMLLAVTLFFTMSISSKAESSESTTTSEKDYLIYAETVIKTLFENKDLGTNKDIEQYVSPSLLALLQSKIETHRYSAILNNNVNLQIN